MAPLRFVLIVLNTAAIAVLLAIPIGKLLGVIEDPVGAAAVYGWLIFFVPLIASLFSLWGIQFSRPSLTRNSVAVALLGSFLVGVLSLAMSLMNPPGGPLIGIGAAALLGLNVLVLWRPFLMRMRSEG
ncbi:MAG: hypothetical protein P8Y29_10140 [Gemmatimonadota bacterium]|jgi:hypothetical protein